MLKSSLIKKRIPSASKKMKKLFISSRKVEFSETDAAGFMHFSKFFPWMETAEQYFLESLNIPFFKKEGSLMCGWPKVHATCDYKTPLFCKVKKNHASLISSDIIRCSSLSSILLALFKIFFR